MKRLGKGGAVGAAALALGSVMGLVAACGQDTGYLYEKETIQETAQATRKQSFDLTESIYHSLTWFNQCASAPMPVPTRGPLDPVITGAGPHKLFRQHLTDVPVTLMGKVCPPRAYHRDVVVMVGVSGASRLLDRFDGNTCKRFAAVQTILDSLPAGSRMGLATFEEAVRVTSSGLFATKAELYANLAGTANPSNQDIAKIVCGLTPADAGGPTNFNVGFIKAKELLSQGRGDQTKKEVILIADGYNPGGAVPDPIEARAIRNELTGQGIDINGERIVGSVATLLVGSDANRVHEYASVDRSNQPLRGDLTQTANVARAIGSIATNVLVNNTLRLRVIGTTAWQTYNVAPHMNANFEYAIPSFVLPIDLDQAGFEMEGEYADTHGNRTAYNGRIEWADGP